MEKFAESRLRTAEARFFIGKGEMNSRGGRGRRHERGTMPKGWLVGEAGVPMQPMRGHGAVLEVIRGPPDCEAKAHGPGSPSVDYPERADTRTPSPRPVVFKNLFGLLPASSNHNHVVKRR